MNNIAITVIAYNRVNSLKRLLKSLSGAFYDGDKVTLIISIDRSDSNEVLSVAEQFSWTNGNKVVIYQEERLGLRKHILKQGDLLEQYDAIIVLEDDVVVAPDFWSYTKQTVSKYQDCKDIAGISLYSYSVNYHKRHPFIPIQQGDDVYFMNCAMSWGQIWMKKQWHDFMIWYEQNQNFPPMAHLPKSICSWSDKSWLKYHMRYCIEENKYFVFPYISYATNYNDPGSHIQDRDCIFQIPMLQGRKHNLRLPDWNNTVVKYDAFFENKQLYNALKLKEEDCCLDLNGTNDNQTKKRFWLTTRNLPYKIVRSYEYSYKPLEINILNNHLGKGIYLYDTEIYQKKSRVKGNPTFLTNHFIQNSFLFIREYGYANFLEDFIKTITKKIKRR